MKKKICNLKNRTNKQKKPPKKQQKQKETRGTNFQLSVSYFRFNKLQPDVPDLVSYRHPLKIIA